MTKIRMANDYANNPQRKVLFKWFLDLFELFNQEKLGMSWNFLKKFIQNLLVAWWSVNFIGSRQLLSGFPTTTRNIRKFKFSLQKLLTKNSNWWYPRVFCAWLKCFALFKILPVSDLMILSHRFIHFHCLSKAFQRHWNLTSLQSSLHFKIDFAGSNFLNSKFIFPSLLKL